MQGPVPRSGTEEGRWRGEETPASRFGVLEKVYGKRANIRLDGHVYTRTFDRWSGVCLSIRILCMCSRHGIGLPEPMPWLLGLDLCPAFTWCLCSFEGVDFVSLSLSLSLSGLRCNCLGDALAFNFTTKNANRR
jgi:hypothetical protein